MDFSSHLSQSQKYEFNKLVKHLRGATGKAIADFNMIEDGDKIMVCLSGGKDSYVMLDILLGLQRSAPIHFDLIAVNLDQKLPGYPEEILPHYLDNLGVDYRIIEEDTFSVVQEKMQKGKNTCSLCSRLRRGMLYRTAKELGIKKIALGHHKDDILQTLLLNMFFGGRLEAMPPKYLTDDGEYIIIRPLSYCREKDIIKFAQHNHYPIIPANLCGFQPETSQRESIKKMLNEWDVIYPGRIETMFKAISQVIPSHLADTKLFNFKQLQIKK